MNWQDALISLETSIREAIQNIERGPAKICLVVDCEARLVGTVTDGDIRRGLLRGLTMEAPVREIMKVSPRVVAAGASRESVLAMMKVNVLRQIPKLDKDRRVVGLAHIDELIGAPQTFDNWVVLMAGGMGTRLRPYTEKTPKPLLSVGDKPILETILESFIEQNFRQFYISVNYKADAIKEHFGDGGKWNAAIRYLEEETRLGTAGALQLMSSRPDLPLVVMNGDLLTRINFGDLLDYHRDQGAKATMCVREYDFKMPFGVVEIENHAVRSIEEKPVHRVFVNAGIYVLDSSLIDLIPAGEFFDMTDLFDRTIENGLTTAAFPIHEYWLDVGRLDDLNRANIEFKDNFRP